MRRRTYHPFCGGGGGIATGGVLFIPLGIHFKAPQEGPLRSAVSALRPAEGLADVLALAGDNMCSFGAGARRQQRTATLLI